MRAVRHGMSCWSFSRCDTAWKQEEDCTGLMITTEGGMNEGRMSGAMGDWITEGVCWQVQKVVYGAYARMGRGMNCVVRWQLFEFWGAEVTVRNCAQLVGGTCR